MDIQDCLREIMNNYLEEKNKPFKDNQFNSKVMYEIPEIFYNELNLDRSKYVVTASCGKGNWATIPWIVIFNKSITTSATRGYYVVVLFRADMKGLYVTLGQGYTWFTDNFKPKNAKENVKSIAEKIRKEISLPETTIDLRSNNELAVGYQLGNIYSKYYETDLSNIKNDIWKMLEYLYKIEVIVDGDWESFNWKNIDDSSLKDSIIKAMINLHKATNKEWLTLQEIYEEVERITGKPNSNGGASIRATLQKYCSQTETYIEGARELFEVKKIGSGEWKYKYYQNSSEIDSVFNTAKLNEIINSYISNFEDYRKEEVYKWEAIKHFQNNWNIDSDDFAEMLNNALSKSYNLLNSYMYFPQGMIVEFAKKDPQITKEMFKNLFNEELSIEERYNYFIDRSDELLKKYWESGKNHYQDAHTISVYLTFMYPDRYYMYKSSVDNKVAKLLNANLYDSDKSKQLLKYFELCEWVLEKIKDNNELIELHKNNLNDKCYLDEELHVLAWDILYYGGTQYKEKNYWIYAPGENAKKWNECIEKSIMSLGWDEIDDLRAFKTQKEIKDELNSKNGVNSSQRNDSLALYEFAYKVKPGDIVIVKKGTRTLLGYGIVSSDYYFDSQKDTYKHIRDVKWIKKGEWDTKQYTNFLNQKQLVQKTLTDISKYEDYPEKLLSIMEGVDIPMDDEKNNTNYYWLQANPNIWQFSSFNTGDTITYDSVNANGNKRRIYKNFLDLKIGDIAIVYEATPTKAILGLAQVISKDSNNNGTFKKVEQFVKPIPYSEVIQMEELKNAEFISNNQGTLFRLTNQEFQALMDTIREENPIQVQKQYEKYEAKDFLKEVFMEKEEYETIKALLKRKLNVILQGPPGVGKTFMAKRLAYSIMGEKNPDRIKMIQFHQSYSYEDFIQGYRPSSEGNGFKIVNGAFYNFCTQAANDLEHSYFFIIDEINRGNLSKIFGEVLMLVENDKRGKERVNLIYSPEIEFTIPKNVFIIGTMNTADRSLAIIDYALRRRFSFVNIKPAFDNSTFQNEIIDKDVKEFINKIKELNIDIDETLGKGFEIGHSYFCNLKGKEELNAISKYEIMPLLEEYWFDDESRYKAWYKKLVENSND